MKNLFTKTLLSSSLMLAAGSASAAAFQLAEVSSSGLGMSYAGNAAVTDNASVVATNPALMTKFKQSSFSVGGVFVDADVHVKGTFLGQDASHKNIIPTAWVPNMYIVAPLNEKWSVGGGVNVNYGLKSEYGETFPAGVYGGKTELTALNLNLSTAYHIGYGFSFGFGLNAIYADAEVARYLGTGGTALSAQLQSRASMLPDAHPLKNSLRGAAAQLGAMPANTVVSRIKGDEWSLGWNAGLTYELNENHRWGLGYRSAVNVKFKGEYSNDFPVAYNALLGQLAASGVSLPISQAAGGNNLSGRLNLHLPASWEFSGFHRLTDKLTMQYSYKLTEWRRFKSLDAYGADGKHLFHKTENFSNSSRYALGFAYDVNHSLTLRTGIAYDENASVKHPSISIPDTDRMWYSVGATYRFTPNLSVDLGYAHLRGNKRHFKEGSAEFKTKSKANLYGLNLNYRF